MNITKKEEELINFIRENKFGEVIVVFHNSEPQVIKYIKQEKKILVGLTFRAE